MKVKSISKTWVAGRHGVDDNGNGDVRRAKRKAGGVAKAAAGVNIIKQWRMA